MKKPMPESLFWKRVSEQLFYCEVFKNTSFPSYCFSKYESLYKLIYGNSGPQFSEKKLFLKCLENIQEYIWIRLQLLLIYKLHKTKDCWIHITIKVRYHKTSKIRLHFSKAFLGELICWDWGSFLESLFH